MAVIVKTCKECKREFVRRKIGVNFCSPICQKINQQHKAYMKRKVTEKKVKKKTEKISTLLKKFEEVFNRYIRLRDQGKPCISCGEYNELQAGHYFAVSGYKALRFDEDNVHGECARCNCFNESHLIGYGLTLEKKIGINDYKALIKRGQEYKAGTLNNDYYINGKWDKEGIKKGIELYTKKCNELIR